MEEDINIEVMNREILDAITDAEDGQIKNAASAASNMIRRRIREDGFSRNILPPKTVTNDGLDRVPDHDRPVIIEDMEPGSKGAKSIPFGDSADTSTYYGNKFVCSFNVITTPEFTKDINELRTYRMDLRKVITDNALRDMQAEEDYQFINTVDAIVGNAGGQSAAGYNQHINVTKTGAIGNVAGGGSQFFSREDYVQVLSVLEDLSLNNGVVLMNRKTAKSFLTMDRSEIGGDLAQTLLTDGLGALQEAEIFGVRHLFTIKRDIIPDDTVYIFAEPEYLGRFYTLQDPTMYVEKKKDILRFSARETLSVTFANLAGLGKVTFQ
tara:strand:- start:21247 stop:22218 length:972 start_codon:yes stop_codon:yes gene_type:complete